MKYFRLPDLGEGLTEAEICEWLVKAGDEVEADQLLVTVETAKAIVEIPSPVTGKIAALFSEPGDMVHVGEPLVEFVGADEDAGTVVGQIQKSGATEQHDHFIVGSPHPRRHESQYRATPAVKALAEHLGVRLDDVHGSAADGSVGSADVERVHGLNQKHGQSTALRGVRRTMSRNMTRAHAEVVPVTLFEDADVHDWEDSADISVHLAFAIATACAEQPALNAWFDGKAETCRLLSHVDLGVAVNTADGLFVPVLRDVGNRTVDDLRSGIDKLRADVENRSIPTSEMIGATFTLSNFGTLGGRYGTPVVIPPMVAILGAGEIREMPVVHDGDIKARRILPLSLTFDHRAVTGAEAAGFLGVLVRELRKVQLR